jgi:hypothetical protein
MAATRLSDSQKSELVARFRAGVASQELAVAFGCSPNTVSRVVKAALDPADYARLKQLRGARKGHPPAGEEEHRGKPAPVAPSDAPADAPAGMAAGDPTIAPTAVIEDEAGAEAVPDNEYEDIEADEYEELEDDLLDEEEGDDDFLPIPVALAFEDHAPREPLPLAAAPLPASLYMLVDKTVELQARPLCDFPELGSLPQEERQRQALLVFANPRQAKRQCGRSQRVIKLPDARVLERTASYLLAQGISRVVIEGALYSLPGS